MPSLLQFLTVFALISRVYCFRYFQQPFRPATSNTAIVTSSSSRLYSTAIEFDFKVGEEYEGKVISALPFGVFVDIAKGTNVLLPRSILSKSHYQKLKAMSDSSSTELIKLKLDSVSVEQRTLSGKYISGNSVDISTFDEKELQSKIFTASVVSAHDFGVFAEIEEFELEGLIPASKLGKNAKNIKADFPVGKSVQVKVAELKKGEKKMILSLERNENENISGMIDTDQTRWFSAIVETVTNFGMFVRPAGTDVTGLVHQSQVPRDLIAALKQSAPVAEGNKTDVEWLFSAGDVIKCRVKSSEGDKLGLSMLPYKEDSGKDDGYVVEGRDPEGEEFKSYESDDSIGRANYDAQDTLVWWKGQPYQKVDIGAQPVDDEVAFVAESTDLVSGSFRRLFEIDLRADQADFSSKIFEKEEAELKEEIGELAGLDDDLLDDMFGLGSTAGEGKFGSYVSMSQVPNDWKAQMGFAQDLQTNEDAISSVLKSGKKGEQSTFESLLKEIEGELGSSIPRPEAVALTPEVDVIATPPPVEEEQASEEEGSAKPPAEE